MSNSLRRHGIRILTALFATLAVASLGVRADVSWADDPGGEDIVVPPPPPAPAPARARAPAPAPAPAPPPPADPDDFHLYLSGNVGGSFAKGRSSGSRNLAGVSFANIGNDEDETVFGGGALGIHYDLSPVGLRAEIEGQAARGYEFNTIALQAAAPGFAPMYTQTNTWAMFGNFWLDFPITEYLSLFGGGGVGFAVTDIRATVVGAGVADRSADDTTFAWQTGGGVTVAPVDWLAFDLGYRFIDLGEPHLTFQAALPPSDLDMHLQSHDVVMGVRINFFSF